jgi:polysaccharide biosynthesis protein PslA
MAGVRCKRFELGIKRALDVVASASILVALSPLLLLTALAIMLETNGPVFSVNHENYYRRRSIRVVRFRTGETHVGRMLRRTGLDRLPKLFNVLRGDLSIIGPRCQVDTLPSLVPDVVVDPLYENVFRPRLISLKLPDELANPIVGQSEADLYYVSHWSLWFDVKILFLHLLSKETYL